MNRRKSLEDYIQCEKFVSYILVEKDISFRYIKCFDSLYFNSVYLILIKVKNHKMKRIIFDL